MLFMKYKSLIYIGFWIVKSTQTAYEGLIELLFIWEHTVMLNSLLKTEIIKLFCA